MMNLLNKRWFPASFCLLLLLAAGCAPRIYRPPALGAEYRFDEGLKPQKPKQRLFDKDMQKYLEERGISEKEASNQPSQLTSVRKDSGHVTVMADTSGKPDTSRPNTLTSPARPASSASPDSSHSVPR